MGKEGEEEEEEPNPGDEEAKGNKVGDCEGLEGEGGGLEFVEGDGFDVKENEVGTSGDDSGKTPNCFWQGITVGFDSSPTDNIF